MAKALQLYDARRRPLVGREVIQRRFRISRRTLANWMKGGKIPFIKIGGKLYFSIEKVDQALERFEHR